MITCWRTGSKRPHTSVVYTGEMAESKMESNRVVIITGAGAGIGEEITYVFAKKGFAVSMVDIVDERLKKVEDQLKEMGIPTDKMFSIQCDLSEESSVEMIINQTVSKFGQIDVLVNNAGHAAFFEAFEDLTVEAVDKCYKVMLRAPLFLSQKAFPHLKKTKGSIVNISSVASKMVMPALMDYSAIKAGLEHVTRCISLVAAPHGIRVNSVHPGLTRTSIFERSGVTKEEMYEGHKKNVPLGRIATPADIASAVSYLASDAASYVTGANLLVDGGALLASPFNGMCY